jgi:hypothetical protein
MIKLIELLFFYLLFINNLLVTGKGNEGRRRLYAGGSQEKTCRCNKRIGNVEFARKTTRHSQGTSRPERFIFVKI